MNATGNLKSPHQLTGRKEGKKIDVCAGAVEGNWHAIACQLGKNKQQTTILTLA
ncbi:hypothetical protein [Endozoicomonas ascidiicola]|uniref:hypothetical protein n=1 Tax=Endozoicomonas ascidiicola TaxID=1698521 RepID=UPI0012FE7410|nr:hypothetical protein [Endozoicomonas ascidiicola]